VGHQGAQVRFLNGPVFFTASLLTVFAQRTAVIAAPKIAACSGVRYHQFLPWHSIKDKDKYE
jgi:hypothetical protein